MAIRATYRLFAVFLAVGMAFAQSAAVGGKVLDPSGTVVTRAEVSLTNELNGSVLRSKSNAEGLFVFPFVASGKYTLTVTAPDFRGFERTHLSVETGQTLAVDVSLQVGEVAQTITVDGSGAYINTVDASVSTVVDRRFVENLPMNGRSLQALMALVPGVTIAPSSGFGYSGDITVNGQRTEANYFTVDGVSANVNTGAVFNPPYGSGYSGTTAAQTALGTTHTMVSLDALAEFRVATSTYSAEYGRTPGGQFSLTTRSGTNEFHGSLFEYFRNDALDANDFFSNRLGVARQAKRQNDFGGTLGGPLLFPGVYSGRNRTFFFASYEGLRLRVPQPAADIEVPTLQLRQAVPAALQPFLNIWPLPTGADRGNGFALYTSAYSNPGSVDTGSIRLDHSITDRLRLFGRYNYSPSDSGRRIAATRQPGFRQKSTRNPSPSVQPRRSVPA